MMTEPQHQHGSSTTILLSSVGTSTKVKKQPRRSSILLSLLGITIVILEFQQIYYAHKSIGGTIETASSSPQHQNQDSSSRFLPPPLPQNPPLRQDNNSTFSACLLVMDDNHFLIEWLAYHYTTLPLRYLVIAVDPRSSTSPKLILDRWSSDSSSSELDMTIVRWNDDQFLPLHWQDRIMSEEDPIGLLQKHRERQKHFYPACFEYLQNAGRQWTAVIDIDEFIVAPNINFINLTLEIKQQRKRNGNGNDGVTSTTKTFLQQIRDNTPTYHHPDQACITIPRLRIGNFEDDNTTTKKLSPPNFHDKDFLTYRYRYRAGLHDRKTNRNPKSILQLQRISNFSRKETDAHLPVRSVCPKRNLYILNRDSPYVVHHYSGSVEQFQFRKDARTGTANRDKIVGYSQIQHSVDLSSAQTWLPKFIKQVPGGIETARQLLDGVGNVSYTSGIGRQMMQEGNVIP